VELRRLLQPVGDIDRVAEHGEFEPRVVADGTDEGLALMHADPDFDRILAGLPARRVLLRKLRQDGLGAGDRASRIVRSCFGNTEHQEGTIADELVDDAAMLLGRKPDAGAELAHDRGKPRWIERLSMVTELRMSMNRTATRARRPDLSLLTLPEASKGASSVGR